MKKILPVLFALALIITCLWAFSLRSNAATVDNGTCGANLTWTLDDAGTLTISGTGPMTNYEFSSRVPWYSNRSSIKNVIIESGVTTIGDSAFYSCDSLTSVTIVDSVTNIGEDAFAFCDSLTTVTIPDSVTTIGDYAFSHCDSLTTVTIPDSVTTIGDSAFFGCDSLNYNTYDNGKYLGNNTNPYVALVTTTNNSISACEIHSDTKIIGNGAFNYCDSLTTVTIPDSVTTIGDWTFYHCDSLTTVTIGDSVTTIGDYAFERCYSLTSVTIPDSVTTIGDSAFFGCDSLNYNTYDNGKYLGNNTNPYVALVTTTNDSISACEIHSDTKIIGIGAFNYCDSLTSVTIPDSVTTIGDYAFYHCDSLTSVTIPDSVTTIGEGAFRECTSLTSVTIPDSVTTIGEDAFYSCDSLTTVTIPDSVTTIGDGAFSGCDSLTDVYYADTSAQWNEISIDSYNYDLTDATIHYSHTHDYSLFDPVTVEATCSQEGYIEYTCAFGDSYRVVLPKLPHDYSGEEIAIAPTCTDEGYTGIPCIRCKAVDKKVVVPALNHDYNGTRTMVDPTCTSKGYTDVACIRCSSVQKQDEVSALGHKMVVLPAVSPTCTETGLTAGTRCERCQYVGIAQSEVPAAGHSFADGVCANCGEKGHELGNLDGTEGINEDDVIYLLQHLLMPEDFPVEQAVDYDHSGTIDEDDVIYLLQHLLMPEDFPLT